MYNPRAQLVLMNDKGLCVWEPGTNRKLSVTDSFTDHEEKTVEVVLQWGLRDVSDWPPPAHHATISAPHARGRSAALLF